MVDKAYEILLLNQISPLGLERFPADIYRLSRDADRPHAILVRSQDMHAMNIPDSVRAIGRAGAGTNNIPVKMLSGRGVPVFNAPGANANAVKELVLAGMLIAARNIGPALAFINGLAMDGSARDDAVLSRRIEAEKKAFAGYELPGHTLGVIGLGRIGSLVADTAIKLGMNVLGYDPDITVDAAWSLPAQVKKAQSIEEVMKNAHFITLHVPLVDRTRNLIDADLLGLARKGAVLLNFSRDGIVDAAAIREALSDGRLNGYVTDFPVSALAAIPGVIALPHLGASTREAEDNCAIMVVDQVRDFLQDGNVRNAVNFPDVFMARESPYRIAVANANVPNMVGQVTGKLASAGLNIHNMLNRSRADMAYTLADVDSAVDDTVIGAIAAIPGVLGVRYLPLREE